MASAGTVRPAVFLAYITVALAFRGALVAPLRARRPPAPRAFAVSVTAEEALAVLDGAIDTAEDAALHLRRLVRGTPAASTLQADFADDTDPRPRLVILGSGWAAHALIKVIDTDTWRVLVVSPRNYFVFTPMLAATSVGTVEYRSITEPIREANPECSFVEGLATDIDVERRRVSVALSARAAANGADAGARADGAADVPRQYDVPYDVLAFACGVEAAAASVPGAAEYCFRLKDVEDAQQLRRAVGDPFEADLHTPTHCAHLSHCALAYVRTRWATSSSERSCPGPRRWSARGSSTSWWSAAVRRASNTRANSPISSRTSSRANTLRSPASRRSSSYTHRTRCCRCSTANCATLRANRLYPEGLR